MVADEDFVRAGRGRLALFENQLTAGFFQGRGGVWDWLGRRHLFSNKEFCAESTIEGLIVQENSIRCLSLFVKVCPFLRASWCPLHMYKRLD